MKTFKPSASIVLRKNIGRATIGDNIAASERFRGARRDIELLDYLGENGSIVVSKSVREPAGMFTIALTDKMVPELEDSLYGLVEPMDVIDIRMARDKSVYAGAVEKSMPMMMRGLVTGIRRSNVMSPNGPVRAVIISGQDYGKILQIMQIQYLPGFVLGQDLLTSFNLVVNYGPGATGFESAAKFIVSLVEEVVNPFISTMKEQAVANAGQGSTSPMSLLGVDAVDFGGGVSPYGANQWPGGAIYELMTYFGDVGPWAELFVEDREEGPYIVYRPTPFKAVDGSVIQTANELAIIDITDEWLIQLDVGRSDAGVANYFWVGAPRYTLANGALLQAAAQQEGATGPSAPQQGDYPNSASKLYGFRIMKHDSQQGQRVDGQPEEDFEQGSEVGIAMIEEKRTVLIANNKDNIVFEDGTMRLRGDERIRAGCYVRLTRRGNEDLISENYAPQVVHEYTFDGYITTVSFERGTGFIERLKRAGGASNPYLGELNIRGAYQ